MDKVEGIACWDNMWGSNFRVGGERQFAQDIEYRLFTLPELSALKAQEYARGREAGLEEAAKEADICGAENCKECGYYSQPMDKCLAARIRTLAEKGESK
jgi:hypothetical protein